MSADVHVYPVIPGSVRDDSQALSIVTVYFSGNLSDLGPKDFRQFGPRVTLDSLSQQSHEIKL